MKKDLATIGLFDYSLGMETQVTTTQLIESGTSSRGFAYAIKIHLRGEKAQYYTLRGTQAEKVAFFHSSLDLAYLRRTLKESY